MPIAIPVILGVSMLGIGSVAFLDGKKNYLGNFADSLEDTLVRLSHEVKEFPTLAMISKANMVYSSSVKKLAVEWVNDKQERVETLFDIDENKSTDFLNEYKGAMADSPEIETPDQSKGFRLANKSLEIEGVPTEFESIEIDFRTARKQTAETVNDDFLIDPTKEPSSYEKALYSQSHFLKWLGEYMKVITSLNLGLVKTQWVVAPEYSIERTGINEKDYQFVWGGEVYKVDVITGSKILGSEKALPYQPLSEKMKESLMKTENNVVAKISNPDLTISNPTVALESGSTVGIDPNSTVGVDPDVKDPLIGFLKGFLPILGAEGTLAGTMGGLKKYYADQDSNGMDKADRDVQSHGVLYNSVSKTVTDGFGDAVDVPKGLLSGIAGAGGIELVWELLGRIAGKNMADTLQGQALERKDNEDNNDENGVENGFIGRLLPFFEMAINDPELKKVLDDIDNVQFKRVID